MKKMVPAEAVRFSCLALKPILMASTLDEFHEDSDYDDFLRNDDDEEHDWR